MTQINTAKPLWYSVVWVALLLSLPTLLLAGGEEALYPDMEMLRQDANNQNLPHYKRKQALQILAFYALETETDSMYHYIDAYDDLMHLVDTKYKIQGATMIVVGKDKVKQKQLNLAIEYLRKAAKTLAQIEDTLLFAEAKLVRGDIFRKQGKIDEALKLYRIVDTISKELNFSPLRNAVLKRTSAVYIQQSMYAEALEHIYARLRLVSSTEADEEYGEALLHLGQVYYQQGDYDQALEQFRESVSTFRKENSGPMVRAMLSEARCLRKMGNYDSSLTVTRSGQKLAMQKKDSVMLGKAYVNEALLQLHFKNYDQAESLLEESHKLFDAKEESASLVGSYNTHAQLLLREGDLESALRYVDMAYLMASEQGYRQEMRQSLMLLSTLFEKAGNYDEALRYYKKYSQIKDSIYSKSNLRRLNTLQSQYRLERQQRELEIQRKDNRMQELEIKRQENLLISLVVITIIIIGSVFAVIYWVIKFRKQNKELVAANEELQNQKEELSKLGNVKDKVFSIISHDLRSPLISVYSTLELMRGENLSHKEVRDFAKKLSHSTYSTLELLNTLLFWGRVQMNGLDYWPKMVVVSMIVEETIDILEPQVDSKLMKLENQVDMGVIVHADENMVRFVLRNLISNAIKFTPEEGYIYVDAQVYEEQQEVLIRVIDSGVGIKKEYQDKLFRKNTSFTTRGTNNEIGTGLGLNLCREFVERMGGRIWVESEEGEGSIFQFTLPNAATEDGPEPKPKNENEQV